MASWLLGLGYENFELQGEVRTLHLAPGSRRIRGYLFALLDFEIFALGARTFHLARGSRHTRGYFFALLDFELFGRSDLGRPGRWDSCCR